MSDDPDDVLSRHEQVLADGEHLLSRLRMRDVAVDGADLAVELDVDATVANPRGALQGGLVATLADIVAGRIANAGLEAGSAAVTADLNIHYAAGVVGGTAHAVGTLLRRGRRSILVRVDVFDGRDGPLAAAATLTFSVVRMPEGYRMPSKRSVR